MTSVGTVFAIAGLLVAYTFVGALSAKLAKAIGERRGWCDIEAAAVLTGAFWPVAWPVIGLAMFAVGAYWLVDGGCSSVAKAVAKGRRDRRERLDREARCRVPVISVPPGAPMTLEAYRTLKPLMSEFERTLPVLERE